MQNTTNTSLVPSNMGLWEGQVTLMATRKTGDPSNPVTITPRILGPSPQPAHFVPQPAENNTSHVIQLQFNSTLISASHKKNYLYICEVFFSSRHSIIDFFVMSQLPEQQN